MKQVSSVRSSMFGDIAVFQHIGGEGVGMPLGVCIVGSQEDIEMNGARLNSAGLYQRIVRAGSPNL